MVGTDTWHKMPSSKISSENFSIKFVGTKTSLDILKLKAMAG